MSGPNARRFEELRPYADAVLAAADREGALLRLMGGLAIRERTPDLGGLPEDQRLYDDFDVVGRVRHVRAIDRSFGALGYRPDTAMNTQFGTMRRIYHHPEGFHVDVFLDRLEFCHTIELTRRLELSPRTLTPADLLLQKLQIVERNLKDHIDVWWLLLNHELSTDPGSIEIDRVTGLTASDWGLHTTVSDFLDDTRRHLAGASLHPEARARVDEQIAALQVAIAAAPKTMRWRARERIGRRVRWYRLVEEAM